MNPCLISPAAAEKRRFHARPSTKKAHSVEEFLEREPEDGALKMWLDVLVQCRALPEQVALTILVSDKAFAEGDKG